MAHRSKVPVTILSGQLGSGKSTLLKRILTNQSRFKIAVVMNEFAQTADIEGKSIQLTVANEGTQVQEWLELDNGCLCCSAQDQGVLALESLMQRRGTFDYIIIETTGIADPSQIALLFWLDSALESLLYLDGIVTVIDCVNLEKQLPEEAASNSGTLTKQIAVADSLYLSKVDLASQSTVKSIKQVIQNMNDTAFINQSDEDLEMVLSKILNLDSFSVYQQIPKSLTPSSEDKTGPIDKQIISRLTRAVGNLTEPNFRPTHESFSTITIDLPVLENVDTSDSKFDRTFRKLLWEGVLGGEEDHAAIDSTRDQEPRILRAKGLLKDLSGKWFILQAVRDTYEVQPIHMANLIGDDEHPKLVLIGKNLNNQLKLLFLEAIS